MAGDPCQLPPVVASPAAVTPCPAAVAGASAATGPAEAAAGPVTPAVGPAAAAMEPAATAVGSDAASPLQQPSQQSLAGIKNPATGVGLQGLARPLLVRLTQMGHKAHLLRTQYRQSTIHTKSMQQHRQISIDRSFSKNMLCTL